ncbi:protein-disulfide reductase DsbD [Parvibium lacunae]|uniref:Thiol:disulfide interchange protein DsbD n=1 Tax=Parvibium lacunae TaxID=1888893 RepID=A0A368KYY9_9BURK|nr:protein-disulfide reductase DsbD [Parvibium lacunae]RCS56607.1 protein-disulfide reductase DsbD [Parvibium lacunae]
MRTIHSSSLCRFALIWLTLTLLVVPTLAEAWFGKGTATEFLAPQDAFKLQTEWLDEQTLQVHYRIAPGYYLYRERFDWQSDPAGSKITAALPVGKPHFDETFNKTLEIYRDDLRFTLVVTQPESTQALPLQALRLISQGCADAGLCYPPQTTQIAYPPRGQRAPANTDQSSFGQTGKTEVVLDESGQLQSILASRSLWLALPIFFGLGLLLAFTPCVLPMLPILSSIISGRDVVGNKAHPHPWRAFQLALWYSLGMILVYTMLGVAAGLAGQGLAQLLQTPAALISFALVLTALALSKFGWYELQLPAFLRHRLHGHLESQSGGQALGVFVMGVLSGLMVGPCVAPPLAGVLLYISQSGDPVRGGLALFSIASGMSVPLLILGASAGHWLPKAGAWMNQIKHVFGLLLLGVALWMVQPLLPDWVWPAGVGLLLLGMAVVLRAWQKLPPHAGGKAQFFQWLGIVLGLVGAIELVGVAAGGRDVLQPLSVLRGSAAAPAHVSLPFVRVKNEQALEALLADLASGKLGKRAALLDFYADWCVSCKEMERFTFSDPAVQAALADTLWIQVDVTANNAEDQALLKRFNLFGPPGIVFFDAQGKEIPGARVIGFQNAAKFRQHLAAVQRQIKR